MARRLLMALLLGVGGCGGPSVSPTVVSTPSARESAVALPSATPIPRPLSRRQQALLRGARSRLGDVYSAAYFTGGYPPAGQSACVDVLVYACREVGVDLRREVARDTSQTIPCGAIATSITAGPPTSSCGSAGIGRGFPWIRTFSPAMWFFGI